MSIIVFGLSYHLNGEGQIFPPERKLFVAYQLRPWRKCLTTTHLHTTGPINIRYSSLFKNVTIKDNFRIQYVIVSHNVDNIFLTIIMSINDLQNNMNFFGSISKKIYALLRTHYDNIILFPLIPKTLFVS